LNNNNIEDLGVLFGFMEAKNNQIRDLDLSGIAFSQPKHLKSFSQTLQIMKSL
jgi:hypothetical protein